jgi:HD superfamily phosphohydrolase YqeK
MADEIFWPADTPMMEGEYPMHPMLRLYCADATLTHDLRADVVALLRSHGCAPTAGHSARVAAEAGRIAARWGLNETAATTAGWLHDISMIIPNAERIALAEALELEVLPEERALPMIIH